MRFRRASNLGSALAGSKEMIREARRHRKLFGGGMRQSGIIAAGALYGLEHNIERLAQDHANAQILADAIRESPGLTLSPGHVDTNMVIFEIDSAYATADEFVVQLKESRVLVLAVSPRRVRAVTHLDVSQAEVERASSIVRRVAENGVTNSRRSLVS